MKEYVFICMKPNFTYKIEFRTCSTLKDAKKMGKRLLDYKNYIEVTVCEQKTVYSY